jgi:CRP-like cAMP-binding protein
MRRALATTLDIDDAAAATASPPGNPAHSRLTGDMQPGLLEELGLSVAVLVHAQCTARPRQTIIRAGERLIGIPVLVEGWAVRVSRLPDGRRQILSFLLPGDLISVGAAFTERLAYFVEAVTPVRCIYYDRADFTAQLSADPRKFNAFVKLLLSDKDRAFDLAVDLGRRDASERIARLILHLMQRLEARGLVSENAFDLPLRQQHIADATGLTSVHVNRVFCALRQNGIVEMRNGRLKVLDLAALRRRADQA